jgi:hypothetical protein
MAKAMAKTAIKNKMVREAVGIFDNENNLQAAIDELELAGFAAGDVSVLADSKTIEKKLGHMYKRVEDAEDDPDAPRALFIPKESVGVIEGAIISVPLYIAATTAISIIVVSGGTLLAAVTAGIAGAGAGVMIGSILAHMVAKHHADYLDEQIKSGGILLWVHTKNKDFEKKAVEILKKYSAHDIHVHDLHI